MADHDLLGALGVHVCEEQGDSTVSAQHAHHAELSAVLGQTLKIIILFWGKN